MTTYPEPESPDAEGQVTDPTPDSAGNPDPEISTDAETPVSSAEEPAPDGDGAPVDPVAEAKALLAQYEQSQAQDCAAELEAVLTRYGMRLEVSPAQITLVPADKG